MPARGRCSEEDAVAASAKTGSPSTRPGRGGHSGRARARRGEGELLRGEILDATERLLAQTGDESAVSIRAIAKAVGVTPPSIYLHFADKDELMLACCQRRFDEFTTYVREAVAGFEDPADALRELGRAYVRWGLERQEPYRILFMSKHISEEHEHEDVDELPGMEGFALLVGLVQAAMESGRIRAADPALVAVGLWTVVHGITSLLITMGSHVHEGPFPWPDVEDLIDHQIDTQLRGLSS